MSAHSRSIAANVPAAGQHIGVALAAANSKKKKPYPPSQLRRGFAFMSSYKLFQGHARRTAQLRLRRRGGRPEFDFGLDRPLDFFCTYIPVTDGHTSWRHFDPYLHAPTVLPVVERPHWDELVDHTCLDATVFMLSPWINLGSDDLRMRTLSQIAFEEELDYCVLMRPSAVLMNLHEFDYEQITERLVGYLEKGLTIWLKVPVMDEDDDGDTDAYLWWLHARTQLEGFSQLHVVLTLRWATPNPAETAPAQRWFGEPIAAIWLTDSQFFYEQTGGVQMTNDDAAYFLRRAFGYGHYAVSVVFAFGDTGAPTWPQCQYPLRQMDRCIRALWKVRLETNERKRGGRTVRDSFGRAIQPLSDDINVDHYAQWEGDWTKYHIYHHQIYICLKFFLVRLDRRPIIVVVGAGRGPLVHQVFMALKDVERNLDRHGEFVKAPWPPHVYAVEKNPAAWNMLDRVNKEVWGGAVTVVQEDARCWRPGFKADLFVSEMLGGFGCNELSPEVLDDCLHLCHAETHIMPAVYTSFMMPVCDIRLMRNIRQEVEVEVRKGVWKHVRTVTPQRNDRCGQLWPCSCDVCTDDPPPDDLDERAEHAKMVARVRAHFHKLYWRLEMDAPVVTRAYNRYDVSDLKEAFTFKHPPSDGARENDKTKTAILEWTANETCSFSGFLGFFDAFLRLKDVDDDDADADEQYDGRVCNVPCIPKGYRLYAWDPLYFPLDKPVLVSCDQTIVLKLCRYSEPERVYYTWQVYEPIISRVHNEDGLSSHMPVTDAVLLLQCVRDYTNRADDVEPDESDVDA